MCVFVVPATQGGPECVMVRAMIRNEPYHIQIMYLLAQAPSSLKSTLYVVYICALESTEHLQVNYLCGFHL